MNKAALQFDGRYRSRWHLVVVMCNAAAAKTVTASVAGKKPQLVMPANGCATVVAR